MQETRQKAAAGNVVCATGQSLFFSDPSMPLLPPGCAQIEELEARLAGGEDLNEDQRGKISAKQKVIDEIKKLEDLKASL